MKSTLLRVIAVMSLGVAVVSVSACCGGQNSAKTAECKEKNSSDDCKTCCGGSYSYAGEGSCTCY